MIERIRRLVSQTPVLGSLARKAVSKWTGCIEPFEGSAAYWEKRYRRSGTSGAGSYGALAEFKAEVLNAFVRDNEIESVIELGCGDGNQLLLAEYPGYVGLDVSTTAVSQCKELFKGDSTKRFLLYNSSSLGSQDTIRADLALSLDVVYHLVEDSAYQDYMTCLFNSANRYVIIFSSNEEKRSAPHVRHRHFTPWVDEHCQGWSLVRTFANKYPADPNAPDSTSSADFFVFEQLRCGLGAGRPASASQSADAVE